MDLRPGTSPGSEEKKRGVSNIIKQHVLPDPAGHDDLSTKLAIKILGQCPISCGNTCLFYDHPRKVIMKSVLFLHCPKICELVYVVQ